MENNLEFGEVKISKEVVSSIVAIAIEETEGAKVHTPSLVDKVISKNQPSIKIDIENEGKVYINANIELPYGSNLIEVSNKVQNNIYDNLDIMTSLEIKEINITVSSLYFKQTEQTNN